MKYYKRAIDDNCWYEISRQEYRKDMSRYYIDIDIMDKPGNYRTSFAMYKVTAGKEDSNDVGNCTYDT